MRLLTALLFAYIACLSLAQENPWSGFSKIMGREGELSKDGTYKITVLRTDAQIQNSMGMLIPPEMGLNSYAAFMGTPNDATVIGDICMLRSEIDGVVDALRSGGIEIVALHNHMSGESPSLYFLHFQGRGNAAKLANPIKKALDELGKDRLINEGFKRTGEYPVVDWKAVSAVLQRPVAPVGASRVMKATLPRDDLNIALDGVKLTPAAGLSCWVTFGGCPCGRTMLMGDTVVTRTELQKAIDTFRANGISVTSIHNHTLGQDGSLMFMHIEAEGDALRLAGGVRAAWSQLGSK